MTVPAAQKLSTARSAKDLNQRFLSLILAPLSLFVFLALAIASATPYAPFTSALSPLRLRDLFNRGGAAATRLNGSIIAICLVGGALRFELTGPLIVKNVLEIYPTPIESLPALNENQHSHRKMTVPAVQKLSTARSAKDLNQRFLSLILSPLSPRFFRPSNRLRHSYAPFTSALSPLRLRDLFNRGSGAARLNGSRIAVCLVGRARRFELIGPSIVKNVLEIYLNADLFLHSLYDKNSFKFLLLKAVPRIEGVVVEELEEMRRRSLNREAPAMEEMCKAGLSE